MKGLFVGLSTFDIQFLVSKFPASNTKNTSCKTGIYAGGPATNAAVTFSHLGGESALITIIGRNAFKPFIVNELEHYNVKVTDLIPDIEILPVISGIITAAENGDRTIFTHFPEMSNFKLSAGFPSDIDICLFDGFCLNYAIEAASFAKRNNKPVVLDGGSWKDGLEKLLGNINYAICSSDFYPPDCINHLQTVDYLKNKGIKNIAITRGENSILVFEDEIYSEIAVKQTFVADTLGAGDVFHGAFCYYLLKEHNFAEALTRASYIATESCKYLGTREWLNFVKKNHIENERF